MQTFTEQFHINEKHVLVNQILFLCLYISEYHFLQCFRTLFNIFWKNMFVMNFSFLTDSPKPSTLIMVKIQKCGKSFFWWCSLIKKVCEQTCAFNFYKYGFCVSAWSTDEAFESYMLCLHITNFLISFLMYIYIVFKIFAKNSSKIFSHLQRWLNI